MKTFPRWSDLTPSRWLAERAAHNRRLGIKPLPLFGIAVALAATSVGHAYKEVPPPARVVLPAARTPAESLASITVPAGLELELVASEPQVMDPIDIAWGAD